MEFAIVSAHWSWNQETQLECPLAIGDNVEEEPRNKARSPPLHFHRWGWGDLLTTCPPVNPQHQPGRGTLSISTVSLPSLSFRFSILQNSYWRGTTRPEAYWKLSLAALCPLLLCWVCPLGFLCGFQHHENSHLRKSERYDGIKEGHRTPWNKYN